MNLVYACSAISVFILVFGLLIPFFGRGDEAPLKGMAICIMAIFPAAAALMGWLTIRFGG